jgi:hypothetical protein
MKTVCRAATATIGAWLVIASAGFAQSKPDSIVKFRLLGQAIDIASGIGVGTAVARFSALRRVSIADSLGNFYFENFPVGTHKIEVSRLGYITTVAEITVDTGSTVYVKMIPRPISMEAIVAVVRKLESRRNRQASAVRAFKTEALATANTDIEGFLRSRGVLLSQCYTNRGGFGGFGGLCVYARGRQVPVQVYVDEHKSFGDALSMYYTSEFEEIEYYPSLGMVRMYTHWFLERVARGKAWLDPVF